jgi:hypothetical protein
MKMLAGFQTSGASILKELLNNKPSSEASCCFTNFINSKKIAFEQNGQGLILRPRVFYKVGVPRKVLTGVNALLLRTNVTKKI